MKLPPKRRAPSAEKLERKRAEIERQQKRANDRLRKRAGEGIALSLMTTFSLPR